VLAWIVARIGLPALALAALVALYEFPIVGRVAQVERDARSGYVLETRAIAAEAQLAETQRQLAAGRKALAGYAEALANAQRSEQLASDALESEILRHEQTIRGAGRSYPLTDADLEFLRR